MRGDGVHGKCCIDGVDGRDGRGNQGVMKKASL